MDYGESEYVSVSRGGEASYALLTKDVDDGCSLSRLRELRQYGRVATTTVTMIPQWEDGGVRPLDEGSGRLSAVPNQRAQENALQHSWCARRLQDVSTDVLTYVINASPPKCRTKVTT